MTLEQPENRELFVKSLKHWIGMPQKLAGYSFTGAASISSMLGEGNEAERYLNKLLDSKIPPNTLYVEAGPCIVGTVKANVSLKPVGDGSYDLELPKGGEAIIYPGFTSPELIISPEH